MSTILDFFNSKLEYEIDSWDLFDALEHSEKIIVIDAMSKDAYEREHIPGAVNLPHREMSDHTTSNWDRGFLYVTYCDGIGCNASTKGAKNLAGLGFNVKEMIGGLDWWKRDGYATEGSASAIGKSVRCNC